MFLEQIQHISWPAPLCYCSELHSLAARCVSKWLHEEARTYIAYIKFSIKYHYEDVSKNFRTDSLE